MGEAVEAGIRLDNNSVIHSHSIFGMVGQKKGVGNYN
jgi:hypothetical protein